MITVNKCRRWIILAENKQEAKDLKAVNQITGFQLFSMTTSMVMTVYGFASFAKQGATAFFFLFLAGILWFLPVTRAAGEMASVDGWSKGGVFTWVGHMYNENSGFTALFYQWVHITVGMNTMMMFIIACFSASLSLPAMYNNLWFRYILMLIIIWGLIALQQRGTKFTGKIAQWGFTLGVIIPVFFLLFLFAAYLLTGHHMLITINWHTIFPQSWSGSVLVGFVPFILAFCGAEGSAPHVKNLKNPKAYAKVMLALCIAAICSDIIGSMSIAATIPNDKIQLSNGIVFAYGSLASMFHMSGEFIQRLTGILLALGVLAEISSWVVGPNAGMHEAAKKGYLPARFAKSNSNGIGTNVMILQGIIVCIVGAWLTFGAGGSKNDISFQTAMSLTVAIYMLMYLMMFAAYFRLVNRHDDLHRTWVASRSKFLKNLYAIVGFILTAFALIVTFFPPKGYSVAQQHTYLMLLIVGFVIVFFVPFVMLRYHAKWTKDVKDAGLYDED